MTSHAGLTREPTADNAAGRVARSLRHLVLTGALKPGSRLSQSQLAAEHGVSRLPVRDALQLLAREGLVQLTPAHAVVRGISMEELQELYEMREAIEPVVTRIAVPNVGRAEVTQMAELVAQMESEASAVGWIEANAQFHALVYHRAHRPMMIEMTDQLRRLTDRYLHLHLSVIGNTEHLHQEHRAILDAVRRGDPGEVAELTRHHLATSHEFILTYLLEHPLELRG
jgi:DNA-binding GntR family transcriptional regulator